jgi:arginyl-tRNA synthetase
MRPVIDILEERIGAALSSVTGQSGLIALVKPATDPKFGDYQVNGVMAAAKQLRTNPRQLAEKVVQSLDISNICLPPEIAGPGFINLRLKTEYMADRLLEIGADQHRLAIDKTARPKRTVVDFSCPNIAKQMHVGHLRSTILGDAICRMLQFEGHTVIRQNHIGDWGTQFGRVILGLWHLCMAEKRRHPYYVSELAKLREYAGDREQLERLCHSIRDRHEEDYSEDYTEEYGDGKKRFGPFLEEVARGEYDIRRKSQSVYQYVSALEDAVSGMGLTIPTRNQEKEIVLIPYEALSRHITAMLQRGGPQDIQELSAWEAARRDTLGQSQTIYDMLGVTLAGKDVRGESAYNSMLAGIVEGLKQKGLAVESDGAICVFPEGFVSKEGQPLPCIVQKSDGAFLYATTDLAALKYRIEELKADEIIYVTDARQKLHFEMLFATARLAGWVPDRVKLEHVMFGTVLGEDNTPLKTRSGENVKLRELLDEAVERARAVVEEKNPQLSEDRKAEIARAVGIGAVKYADYTNNRTSDYVFSFDRMLAMDGNTAPYMQYACARVKSIERKAAGKDVDIASELSGIATLHLAEPAELELAKHLIRYGEVIENALADFRPNYLTAFLYELAQKFSGFYNSCPVLAADAKSRPTRLLLCDLTYRTIAHGLSELLGIRVVEQM